MTYRVILTEASGKARTVVASSDAYRAKMLFDDTALHTGQLLVFIDPQGKADAIRSGANPALLLTDFLPTRHGAIPARHMFISRLWHDI